MRRVRGEVVEVEYVEWEKKEKWSAESEKRGAGKEG